MKVYIDTGVFIDYLSPQAIAGETLRSTSRRGRTPQKLFEDAEKVLQNIASSHMGATSSLTYYEVEEALFKQLTSAATGMANASKLRVLAARSIVPQTLTAVRFFGITALDLTAATVEAQLSNVDLYFRGVRAADALHVASAIHFEAEVFITVDEDVLKLDGIIQNTTGVFIKFCDTDVALTIL
ncbi:type II toxin-antitoxin system VapC family toxin [Nostoc sp. CMAA1605]|uniref:type II toxin-antitoxin system VapC family toxin n=1 Tax=Nostoc sp. CMAA1605 TaxID=2055159 RepID=UPI001F3E458D|nr:PIN domain-containing protein [Nostoc sp. CMAA1605]MCF4966336.1 PIN domain-containing protein [Nostoc sp. CMAA1605]